MKNKKLEAIVSRAADDLRGFADDKEEDILAAWTAIEKEAQEQETKPVFRMGFAITLDFDADRMETALSFAVRQKVSRESKIPDPNQDDLPMETVTISAQGKSTTLSSEAFSKIAKKLSEPKKAA